MFVHVCAQWFIVLDRFVKVTACQSIQDICKAQMAIRQIFPRSEKCLGFALQLNYTKLCFAVFYLFAAVCIWYKGDRIAVIIMSCTAHKAGTAYTTTLCIPSITTHMAYRIITIVCLVLDIFAASPQSELRHRKELMQHLMQISATLERTLAEQVPILSNLWVPQGLGVKWLLETATCFSCMTSDMWQPCSHMQPFRSLMLS